MLEDQVKRKVLLFLSDYLV